jgi:hypothetical protein
VDSFPQSRFLQGASYFNVPSLFTRPSGQEASQEMLKRMKFPESVKKPVDTFVNTESSENKEAFASF